MNAITVRTAQGTLLAFGPDNGMYDPTAPLGTTKQREPDYDAVKAEWFRSQPAPVDKRAALFANPLVPQWFKDYLS